MKILNLTLSTFFLLTSALSFADMERQNQLETSPAMKKLGWELIKNTDGILVHKRDIKGSPLVAFRGDAVIEAPIAKVANVLYDTSRKNEWVSDAKESKDVEVFSRLDRIEYNRTSAPWPLDDRDFLFRAKVDVEKEEKKILIHFSSVENKKIPPREGVVRGELKDCLYELQALSPTKTKLILEVQANPKGSIPTWVVNLFQRNWPLVTIKNIRKQVQKPDVEELAGVTDLFYGKNTSHVSAIRKK